MARRALLRLSRPRHVAPLCDGRRVHRDRSLLPPHWPAAGSATVACDGLAARIPALTMTRSRDIGPRARFRARSEGTREMSEHEDRAWLSIASICAGVLLAASMGIVLAADRVAWPPGLPVYDHIVIVVEENKDFDQILGPAANAPYFKQLATEGAVFERMYGEE